MIEGERMDETLSEPEEDIDIRFNPAEEIVPGNYSPGTTYELVQELSGEEWETQRRHPWDHPEKI